MCATATASRKLIKKWAGELQVGIWERCDWSVRLYPDRAVARMPFVKWVNNSGSLDESYQRITGPKHAQLLALAQAEIEDDADYSPEACELADRSW